MGALMQLVAYGAQDVYLTGNNPQMTYFKSVFRRQTNFSIESIKQTLEGNITTEQSNVHSIISRNGDLISNMWIEATLPSVDNSAACNYTNWCNNTGCAFLKESEIDIGGSIIDKHNSLWNDIYNELYVQDQDMNKLINKHNSLTYTHSGVYNKTSQIQLCIPLNFWFTRNKGFSLPLIALQYHEVNIKLTFRALKHLVITDSALVTFNTPAKVDLWVDYIFLDHDERKRFAQSKHTYLIEQVQEHKEMIKSSNTTINLKFKHPVKEIIWVFTHKTRTTEIDTTNAHANPLKFKPKKLDCTGKSLAYNGIETDGGNDYFNYQVPSNDDVYINSVDSGSSLNSEHYVEHFDNMTIKLNVHERFNPRKAFYFRSVQPYQAQHNIPKKHIYCYSFALDPKNYQPSGTCNFSRIDTVELEFNNLGNNFEISTEKRSINVFVVNYNLLQIASGLGGIVFSN